MYFLMIKQKKYDIAKYILETMITSKKNIKFAKRELQTIK